MSVRLIKRQRIDNPQTGISWNLTFVASNLIELGQARDLWTEQGYKVTSDESGQSLQFTVLAPEYDNSPNDFKDRFSIVTEQVPHPIWINPNLRALFRADFPAAAPMQSLALAKRDVNAAVTQANSTNGFNEDTDNVPNQSYKLQTGELEAYKLVLAGVTEYSTKRTVLKRQRTIPLTSISRMTVTGDDVIWGTPELINAFGFPPDAIAMISNIEAGLPVTADGFIWAWWLRDDETTVIVGSGKAEENRAWVFAQWPASLYTLGAAGPSGVR